MKDIEKILSLLVIFIMAIFGLAYLFGEKYGKNKNSIKEEADKNLIFVLEKMDKIIKNKVENFDLDELISDISKACVSAGNVEGELSLAEYLGIGGRSGYEINSSIIEAGKKAKEKMASRCSIIVTLLIANKLKQYNVGRMSEKQIGEVIDDIIKKDNGIDILIDCSRGPGESYSSVKERFGKN
jgi:hypothetical protein